MNRCIFLSYRRGDTAGYAGHIAADLRARLEGSTEIIMDVDHVGPGDPFGQVIERALHRCDTFIALIGIRWLLEVDSAGRRRVDDPHDWVRVELEVALHRQIRVIPVLVDGAPLPTKGELPERLQGLTERQALALDNSTWEVGMSRLARSMAPTQTPNHPVLTLSTTSVDFGTVALNSNWPRRTVKLVNSGVGELNAAASSSYRWLIVATRPDAVDLAVDTSEAGQYEGRVVVRSSGGTGMVDVRATVASQPRYEQRPSPYTTRPVQPSPRESPKSYIPKSDRPRIPSHLLAAVLSVVVFFPTGLPALYFASKVNGLLQRGEYLKAEVASDRANTLAALSWLIILALFVIVSLSSRS